MISDANSGGDSWEDIHMICPNQCVCQRSPYMELSISRWIQLQKGDKTHSAALKTQQASAGDGDEDTPTAENDNEVRITCPENRTIERSTSEFFYFQLNL